MEIKDYQDCQLNIRRITELIDCGIFNQENSNNILQMSAFIDLIICLRDLMHKTEKYAQRIDFRDDILVNDYVKDVTDAITAIRDACCHVNSPKRKFGENKGRGAYNIAYGKTKLIRIGELELKSDYEDDIAFFYGNNRLYLKRHIIRAFEEAKNLLKEHLDTPYV